MPESSISGEVGTAELLLGDFARENWKPLDWFGVVSFPPNIDDFPPIGVDLGVMLKLIQGSIRK